MARVDLSTKRTRNEKKVKEAVKAMLTKHGWFWFMPPANAYGGGGISDILALKAGVFLAIETKSNGNKPSALQKGFLQSVMAESGFGFVVDEDGVPFLQQFLEAFDRACEQGAQKLMPTQEDGSLMTNAIVRLTRPY